MPQLCVPGALLITTSEKASRVLKSEKLSFIDFVINEGYLHGPNAEALKMLQESRFFFGVLALREQFITVEQLQEALAAQVGDCQGKLIGEIMVEKGYLTRNQVDVVLEQKNSCAENQAELLVDIGMMCRDVVEEALQKYSQFG